MVLAQCELHVKERDPPENGHDGIREEEGPSAILVAYVRKPPDVAQVHGIANDGQEEIHLLAPGLPLPLANLSHQGGGGSWDRV